MSSDHARVRILENRRVFDGLIEEASRAFDRSRFRNAAVTLQTAARFAWYNHPGLYRSLKLELLAVQIGEHLPSPPSRRNSSRIDVLHVLSQAHLVGGHTRLVWRWIENDVTRVHSVVITGQQGAPVPTELRQAVTKSGGSITMLGSTSSNLLTRAKRLRRIALDGVSAVVLHIHPFDVIPLIALAHLPVRVVFLNHADHVFWIGGAITSVLADIRPAGRALSLGRRYFSEKNSVILPIPLRDRPEADRRQARALLGFSPEAVVVLCIAGSYKFAAPQGSHFIDIHRDFVMANPNVNIIVVGPDLIGRWRAVNEETDGRFQAVGVTRELDTYYDAADIYVDALPFGSLTSLLDAGLRGLPVLGLNESLAHSVLTSDDVSLPGGMAQFSSRDEYIHELEALAGRPDHRRRASSRVRDAISRDHVSPGWNQHLEHLFETLESGPAGPCTSTSTPPETNIGNFDQCEHALVDLHDASGLSGPLWRSQLREGPFSPALDRARFFLATPFGQRAKSLNFLLPDVLRSFVLVGWGALSRRGLGLSLKRCFRPDTPSVSSAGKVP